MVNRNTIVGVDFLIIGVIVSLLGYVGHYSVPIIAFGFAVAIIGVVILQVGSESVIRDAYVALLEDSIRNVELILEQSNLREKAYFVKLDEGVHAFIPLLGLGLTGESTYSSQSLRELEMAPKQISIDYEGLRGLLLVPPGNTLVKLAGVATGDDLEESLRETLVKFSALASSVRVVMEESKANVAKVQIRGSKIIPKSPFFDDALGSPVSCIAACVIAAAKGQPVRIVDERLDNTLIRLTLEVVI